MYVTSYSLLDREISRKILRHGNRSTCERKQTWHLQHGLEVPYVYRFVATMATVYQFGRFLLIDLLK